MDEGKQKTGDALIGIANFTIIGGVLVSASIKDCSGLAFYSLAVTVLKVLVAHPEFPDDAERAQRVNRALEILSEEMTAVVVAGQLEPIDEGQQSPPPGETIN